MAGDRLLRVKRLEVRRGHLTCLVEFAPQVPRLTSKALVDRVLPAFPALPRHACVNGSGRTFGDVIECTPMPHLLEHMVVDLQVREMVKGGISAAGSPSAFDVPAVSAVPAAPAAAASDTPIVGTSEWVDEAAGLARIDASFADDQVALRALRDAVRALNNALSVMEGSRTS